MGTLFRNRVEALLENDGAPGIISIAERLGLARRTLQRLLAQSGTNHAALWAHERRTRAEALLTNSQHTIQEIAAALGFRCVPSFHRAFVRWTGTTPAAVRAACARDGGGEHEATERRTPSTPYAARVAEILGTLPEPCVVRVARKLGLSVRSLQRGLAAERTTFARVLAAERRARAERLLERPELTLADVADALGFCDAAAFHRAFVRWTGETPGAFRARTAGASGQKR